MTPAASLAAALAALAVAPADAAAAAGPPASPCARAPTGSVTDSVDPAADPSGTVTEYCCPPESTSILPPGVTPAGTVTVTSPSPDAVGGAALDAAGGRANTNEVPGATPAGTLTLSSSPLGEDTRMLDPAAVPAGTCTRISLTASRAGAGGGLAAAGGAAGASGAGAAGSGASASEAWMTSPGEEPAGTTIDITAPSGVSKSNEAPGATPGGTRTKIRRGSFTGTANSAPANTTPLPPLLVPLPHATLATVAANRQTAARAVLARLDSMPWTPTLDSPARTSPCVTALPRHAAVSASELCSSSRCPPSSSGAIASAKGMQESLNLCQRPPQPKLFSFSLKSCKDVKVNRPLWWNWRLERLKFHLRFAPLRACGRRKASRRGRVRGRSAIAVAERPTGGGSRA